MKHSTKRISLILAAVMLATLTAPVFAQGEIEPVVEPTPEVETSSFLDHPIVKLLASFFVNLFSPPAVEEVVEEPVEGSEPPAEPPAEPPVEPAPGDTAGEGEVVEPSTEPLPLDVAEAAVAALHEDEKLGFGVITKLLAIVAQAQAVCLSDGLFCGLTLDDLIAEYQAGASIGELFAKYGKPEYTGVGQIRKASQPNAISNSGKGKGKK